MMKGAERIEEKWKILLITAVLLIYGLPAVSQVDGKAGIDFPNQEEAMETAEETVKAYETGNWDLLRENVQEDAYFYNLGSFDSLTLEQTINYWKKGREAATPVLREDGAWLAVTVPQGARQGNWILHWGNNTLHYPNGETISFPYHVSLKINDDKVSEAHFYYDNSRIIRALGFEIQPPFEEGNLEDDDHNQ
jgi:ketosteroid isomerase-like protein